jgi:hypothetical protein
MYSPHQFKIISGVTGTSLLLTARLASSCRLTAHRRLERGLSKPYEADLRHQLRPFLGVPCSIQLD